jgi:hypothetical protein
MTLTLLVITHKALRLRNWKPRAIIFSDDVKKELKIVRYSQNLLYSKKGKSKEN